MYRRDLKAKLLSTPRHLLKTPRGFSHWTVLLEGRGLISKILKGNKERHKQEKELKKAPEGEKPP
jgi:hypothetical protein